MNCVEDVDLCCPYPTKLDGALACRSSALAAAGLQQQHQDCCMQDSVVPLCMLDSVVHLCMLDSVVSLPAVMRTLLDAGCRCQWQPVIGSLPVAVMRTLLEAACRC